MSRLKLKLAALGRRRAILLGLMLVIVLLLAFGGYKTLRVWDLVRSLQARLDELEAITDDDAEIELGDVGASLRGAYADLQALRSEVALFMPLTRFLGWLPSVGGDLQAAPALLDTAVAVTEAGVTIFDGLEPLVALAEGENTTGEPLALVLETLSDAQPNFEAAQAQLVLAWEHRAEIDAGTLSARTANMLARLDRYLPLMQTALDGGRLLPDLLGASGQRTYLVLAQNNDELRATGGFISAMGTLTLERGEIGDIAFEDSYTVDDFTHPYPDSPPPLLRYMSIDQWVFRDANWSPDFATSAQKALELYQISRDLDVDGVLAIDQHALQTVVAALEPLEIPDWPEAVTGENAVSLIHLAWSPTEVENWQGFDYEWWKQRKSFMGDLVSAMRTKVETSPDQVNWLALARAVFQILDERHLQIWLADPADPAADLLAEQRWDGAIIQTASDYVMVIDANLGYNKANALVQPSLGYRVLVSADGTAQATLTVRHVHSGSEYLNAVCDPEPHYGDDYDDLANRCYWDYLRVYVPAGSQLSSATAHPVPARLLLTGKRLAGSTEMLLEEHGKAVFASFFVLPRGQEIETRFVYQLPPGTLEQLDDGWRYRLLAQKQAGTDAIPLRVTLALPPGSSVQSAESFDGTQDAPAMRQPEPNVVVFDTTLNTDRRFEIHFRFNER